MIKFGVGFLVRGMGGALCMTSSHNDLNIKNDMEELNE